MNILNEIWAYLNDSPIHTPHQLQELTQKLDNAFKMGVVEPHDYLEARDGLWDAALAITNF